jgi:hypothetical protein
MQASDSENIGAIRRVQEQGWTPQLGGTPVELGK